MERWLQFPTFASHGEYVLYFHFRAEEVGKGCDVPLKGGYESHTARWKGSGPIDLMVENDVSLTELSESIFE